MPQARVGAYTVAHSVAVGACEKGRLWQSALSLSSWMPQARMVSARVSHSAAVSAYEKGSPRESTVNLLSLLPWARAVPDAVPRRAVLSLMPQARVVLPSVYHQCFFLCLSLPFYHLRDNC
eukprot:TRINITY_DN15081_c0_g1_i1.p1 TRINITY_DN15081_c0_g1~~TRINITY_DN15081_c0_g1_i1.p1  ORF type:complete len:121 (-),score=4.69 TRINITY_DN15081_c0_g1_i1:241-603(-)